MFGSEEVNMGSPVASATATGGVMLFCEKSLARTAYTWPNIPPRKLHGKYQGRQDRNSKNGKCSGQMEGCYEETVTHSKTNAIAQQHVDTTPRNACC